jgi:hypothetical protein
MTEIQIHGFTFEKWVCDTFFEGHTGSYMRKWDVSPEANNGSLIPASWRGLPVSIKTAKYGSPIGLGDILRQRQIDVPFLMIVGFWRQRAPTEKWIEDIGVAGFSLEGWSGMWGQLSIDRCRREESGPALRRGPPASAPMEEDDRRGRFVLICRKSQDRFEIAATYSVLFALQHILDRGGTRATAAGCAGAFWCTFPKSYVFVSTLVRRLSFNCVDSQPHRNPNQPAR